jgi:hypothetical protein
LVDCRKATVLPFLPLMDDRCLIDLALDSMALDRHSAAIRQDRRTTENRSQHCIERNCHCSREKNYCCCRKNWYVRH